MLPVLQALVLAERVYIDQAQRKIICGTFNQLVIGKVQAVKKIERPDGSKGQMVLAGHDPGCPWVYISLTDVVDGTDIILQLFNVSKNVEIFRLGLTINEKDRLKTVEIVLPLPPISTWVKDPGTLSFDVVCRGEILGSHRLIVNQMPPAEQPPTPEE